MDPKTRRPYLCAGRGTEWEDLVRDQTQGVPMPPFQKPPPEGAPLYDLVARHLIGAPEEVLTDQGAQYHTWRGKSAFRKLCTKSPAATSSTVERAT